MLFSEGTEDDPHTRLEVTLSFLILLRARTDAFPRRANGVYVQAHLKVLVPDASQTATLLAIGVYSELYGCVVVGPRLADHLCSHFTILRYFCNLAAYRLDHGLAFGA